MLNKMTRTSKGAVIAVLVAAPLFALSQNAPSGNADKGKQTYLKQNCYYCHGTVGQGSRDGARIYNTVLNADGLIRYVRKPTGAMPAYTEKVIADQDLRDIYAYLKALPSAKDAKDIPLLQQVREK